MTREVFSRLVAMRPEELRFRVLCEARKLEGRVRRAAFTPAWRRESLFGALSVQLPAPGWSSIRDRVARDDFSAAHSALSRHFVTRTSPFPVNARELPDLVSTILHDFPSAREDAVRQAEPILTGHYDLLGYRAVDVGRHPDWHTDPIHGRRPPLVYWADVPFLDPATGDHKIIWELNRHQHWLILGRARALSGDSRFYRCFIAQLQGWLQANPPLAGTNWASMLELAFRCLSWLWALEFFAGSAGEANEPPWIVDLLVALDRQLTHIEQNLSHYFSPNTHLTGEALALYVAGCTLPELTASSRRVRVGREVLLREANRQICADGGHAELSAHYHRYSTDFYLLAARVARRAGDTAADVFEHAARVQAHYLRVICDQAGIRPQLGDDDGGQLFPICGGASENCRPTLGAAAALLHDGTLLIGKVTEEAYWLCGERAASTPLEAPPPSSMALSSSGYYVSRTARGDHLVFDAGPHGFLNGGHAHSDALAFTLTVSGRPLLVDPGTATYTMEAELRDRFRGTRMHNTVVLDGRPQSEPRGAFHWASTTAAEARVWSLGTDVDYIEGTHAAYAPCRHTRAILSVHGIGWWILDHILGPSNRRTFDAYWHFHPAWRASSFGRHACRLTQSDEVLELASTAPLTLLLPGESPMAMWSPAYGVVEPAATAQASLDVLPPATIATFIPAISALATGLSIESVPVEHSTAGWHNTAFRLRWNDGEMVLLSAVELDGMAKSPDAAPPTPWGTAEVRSDARVGLLIDGGRDRREVVLVNGAHLHVGSDSLVTLPHRRPVVRMAPAVHQVQGRRLGG